MHVRCRRPARSAWWALVALFALSGVRGLATPSDIQPDSPTAIDVDEKLTPGPLLLDDPLEPLPPDRRRTEADEDRVEALARFSAGRAMERQGQFARALRHYQRALRYDPEAESVVSAVVRLAIQLDRQDEAVRACQKVQNAQALNSLYWMKLGIHLVKKGNWEQAAGMYEKGLAAREEGQPTVADVALTLESGRLYHLLEQYPKAADAFARVLEALENPQQSGLDEAARGELLGDTASTYLLMGSSFFHCDRIDEAVAAFEAAGRAGASKGLLGYSLAQVEAHTGKPAEALAKLETYFQEHLASEGVAPYRLLAQILEDLKKDDELVQRLEKLHAEDGENVPLGYFLAETYHKAEQLDKAESLYRSLVAKTPAVTGYRSLVAIYRQTNRPDALLDVLGEAAAKGVTAESLAEEGHPITDDADLVRTLIETARKRHQEAPDQFGHGLRLAVALLALDAGEIDAASEFFDLTLQADADRASETLLTWGLGLLDREQYAMAAGVFQRGVERETAPDDETVLYYYLSGALEMDDRTEEALAAARKAAELNPDSPRFKSRVAWILYRNDRRQEAAEAYTELVEKSDSDFSSAVVRQVVRESRLVLSNLAVLADNIPEAERRLEEVLDEFPDDVAALNDLGYLWADQNVRLERAHRMVRQAVEADPQNAAYRDSLGWALYRLGRVEEALVELEKAAPAEDEPDAEILDHLGDVYHAANQPERAKDAWQRAVRAFEKSEQAEKAKTVQEKLGIKD